MNQHIECLYADAPRFDESELCRSDEFSRLSAFQMQLIQQAEVRFGAEAADILEEYMGVLYEQTELECRHFFHQGYLAGRAEMIPNSLLG